MRLMIFFLCGKDPQMQSKRTKSRIEKEIATYMKNFFKKKKKTSKSIVELLPYIFF